MNNDIQTKPSKIKCECGVPLSRISQWKGLKAYCRTCDVSVQTSGVEYITVRSLGVVS